MTLRTIEVIKSQVRVAAALGSCDKGNQVGDALQLGEPGQMLTLVADDYPHMQEALVACLSTVPAVQVVATAFNGQEALDEARKHTLGLAIVDLQMPVMDGFKLLRELRQQYPAMRLVAVSGHQSPAIAAEAVAAGADTFVSKNDLPFGLIAAVENLLA
jgi:DNA-binding NarL/FixJ family response regulator